MVEPPRTHSNLPCRPASPCITVVRGGLVWSKCSELTGTCPVGLLPPASQRFGMVEPPRTHSNVPCMPASPFITVVRGGSVWSKRSELTGTCPVGLLPPASQRFGVVEPPRTHSNLPCMPASPFITVVRGGSVWLNCSELTLNPCWGEKPPHIVH